MLKKTYLPALYGFLFGTVGLFILSLLSLMFWPIETASGMFMAPGRMFIGLLIGNNATYAGGPDILLSYLFNGTFYAVLFYVVAKLIRENK